MRYTVVFDHIAESWAVVDTLAAGVLIAHHPHEEDAWRGASAAEELWRRQDSPANAIRRGR